jgi:hypothetical protein
LFARPSGRPLSLVRARCGGPRARRQLAAATRRTRPAPGTRHAHEQRARGPRQRGARRHRRRCAACAAAASGGPPRRPRQRAPARARRASRAGPRAARARAAPPLPAGRAPRAGAGKAWSYAAAAARVTAAPRRRPPHPACAAAAPRQLVTWAPRTRTHRWCCRPRSSGAHGLGRRRRRLSSFLLQKWPPACPCGRLVDVWWPFA